MRLKYDDWVEIYTEDRDEIELDSYDDDIGDARDDIECTLLGMEELDHIQEYSWFERLKHKIERVDNDFRPTLDIIMKNNVGSHKPTCVVDPDSFWWRQVEYKIRSAGSCRQ